EVLMQRFDRLTPSVASRNLPQDRTQRSQPIVLRSKLQRIEQSLDFVSRRSTAKCELWNGPARRVQPAKLAHGEEFGQTRSRVITPLSAQQGTRLAEKRMRTVFDHRDPIAIAPCAYRSQIEWQPEQLR